MKLYFRKVGNVYVLDSGDDDSGIKQGEIVSAEIKRLRNYRFLKKYFALMNYAFGVWEPECLEYKGKQVGKSFKQFRKDITILAGYYTLTENVKGEVRAEADSISFGKMDDDKFETLYSKTIDVLLRLIFKNYTREDVDKVVDNIIGFDG
jgi:hypothetical protein